MSSEQMSLETLLKIYLETKDKLREAETAELEIKFTKIYASCLMRHIWNWKTGFFIETICSW